MSRDQLINELSGVSGLIDARPWWQKNLLDELSKITSDTPRPIQVPSSTEEAETIRSGNAATTSRLKVGR